MSVATITPKKVRTPVHVTRTKDGRPLRATVDKEEAKTNLQELLSEFSDAENVVIEGPLTEEEDKGDVQRFVECFCGGCPDSAQWMQNGPNGPGFYVKQ